MKKFLFLLFILFFVSAVSVSAHTDLKSSTPVHGAVVEDNLEEIVLEFETPIEEGKLTLIDEEQQKHSVEDIEVKDNQLIGHVDSPMEHGMYSVEWEIVGEDGHVIQGEYQFTVGAEEQEAADNEPADTDKVDAEPTLNEDDSESDSNSTLMWVIIGLVVIALLAAFMMMRKGKK